MRKIEERLRVAWNTATPRRWAGAHTEIGILDGALCMWLYGHMLAKKKADELSVSLSGHPTNTTFSRLAFLVRFVKRDYWTLLHHAGDLVWWPDICDRWIHFDHAGNLLDEPAYVVKGVTPKAADFRAMAALSD